MTRVNAAAELCPYTQLQQAFDIPKLKTSPLCTPRTKRQGSGMVMGMNSIPRMTTVVPFYRICLSSPAVPGLT